MPSFCHFFVFYGNDHSDHDSRVCVTRDRHSELISDGDPLSMNLRHRYLIDFHSVVVLDEVSERSEEHTSELQSLAYLVCRLLLEKKKITHKNHIIASKT